MPSSGQTKISQRFLEPSGCSDWQSGTEKLGRDPALVQRLASECSTENWVKIFQRRELDACLPVADSSIPAEQEVSRESRTLPSEKLDMMEQSERGCDILFLLLLFRGARGAPRMPGASRRATTYPAIPTNTPSSEKSRWVTTGASPGRFALFLALSQASYGTQQNSCITAHHAGEEGCTLHTCAEVLTMTSHRGRSSEVYLRYAELWVPEKIISHSPAQPLNPPCPVPALAAPLSTPLLCKEEQRGFDTACEQAATLYAPSTDHELFPASLPSRGRIWPPHPRQAAGGMRGLPLAHLCSPAHPINPL